jgi:hypothetical protein
LVNLWWIITTERVLWLQMMRTFTEGLSSFHIMDLVARYDNFFSAGCILTFEYVCLEELQGSRHVAGDQGQVSSCYLHATDEERTNNVQSNLGPVSCNRPTRCIHSESRTVNENDTGAFENFSHNVCQHPIQSPCQHGYSKCSSGVANSPLVVLQISSSPSASFLRV